MSTAGFGPAPSLAADRLPDTPAWVYLLRCADGSLYAGWTNDLARRLHAHRTGAGGAKYTKSHGKAAVQLAYAERCADKSAALKREAALKKLPKAEKEALAADWAARSRLTVRMATPEDAADVVALYNWYVTHGTQTFQYELSTVEEYRQNIADVLEKAPFLVAYTADGRLAGYACAHPWHTRRAFAWDVETTVYCAPRYWARAPAASCTRRCWTCCAGRATTTPLPWSPGPTLRAMPFINSWASPAMA